GPMADEARQHLKSAGYDMTNDGIRSFQTNHGLPESGMVDPMTMGALRGISAAAKRGGKVTAPKAPPPIVGPSQSGMIHSDVPGRTDRLPMTVPKNSYIIPADIPSGLGQGNSMAGAKLLSQILHPHSMRLKVMNKGANFHPNTFGRRNPNIFGHPA